jgi:hypothetical protein
LQFVRLPFAVCRSKALSQRTVPPLDARRSRALVVGLITATVLIAIVATVLILRGWENRELQEELREVRRERGLRY